jgi:hypothetical protein
VSAGEGGRPGGAGERGRSAGAGEGGRPGGVGERGRSAGSGDERSAPGEERGTCTPCRGTGEVVSALGGEQHVVSCPWCGGTGRFQPGRDAQASPAERESRQPPVDQGAAEAGPEQDGQ